MINRKSNSEKVALAKAYITALKKVGVLKKWRHSKSSLIKALGVPKYFV